MLLKRYSLFCPPALGQLHRLQCPLWPLAHPERTERCCCHHPEHYRGSSSTGCDPCFSPSPLLPCPVYFCSRVSSWVTLSSASQGRCLPELSPGHSPRVTPCSATLSLPAAGKHTECSLAPLPPRHARAPEMGNYKGNTLFVWEESMAERGHFFWWCASLREKTNPQRQQHSCRICNDQGISVKFPAAGKYYPLTSNVALHTRAYHCCAKHCITETKVVCANQSSWTDS